MAESTRRYELEDPDVQRMLQVRAGNAAAFEELVAAYQARLLNVLEHLVGRRDLAEDLAQDVFLRVFRARHDYQPEAKFCTWLFTIANNVASNALRSRSRRREVSQPLRPPDRSDVLAIENLAVAGSAQMPARQLDRAERADMVRQAIAALDEPERMALVLSRFEGLSHAEIGQALGRSEKAVKSLLSRTRCKLKTLLEPYMEHGESGGLRPSDE